MATNHSTPTQVCSKCGEEYPLTAEYWHRNSSSNTGLVKGKCKTCARLAAKDWQEANPERAKEKKKQWAKQNAEHVKQLRREWYLRNKEYVAQRAEEYRDKHGEYLRACMRDYYQRHKSRIKCYIREWRYKNPERVSLYSRRTSSKRRAIAKGVPGEGLSHQGVARKWESQRGLCYWCDDDLDETDYHQDHIFPLSRGGTNEARNIVLSCPDCNMKKNDKLPSEWSGRLF